MHAKWAVVFAQLHIGGKNEGIHGFLVRIRNEVLFHPEMPDFLCMETSAVSYQVLDLWWLPAPCVRY